MADAEVTAGGRGRRRRIAVIAAAAVVLLVATAVIGYRVLAPTEVVTAARGGYPPPPTAQPGVVARFPVAPLLVDGRLRVYAAKRQVRADGPIDAKAQVTPYWSYRRWPEQLVGVVADGATVLSRWSDGELVALDARSGRPVWRAAGPRPETPGYAGRRTGALTVYAPAGLHTATARDGRPVAVVTGEDGPRGFDLRSGAELWRGDAACDRDGFTTRSGEYVTTDSCASPQTLRRRDVATGQPAPAWRPDGGGPLVVEPLGCGVARSGCAAMRSTSGDRARGWLLDGGAPVAAGVLDQPDAWLVGEAAVRRDGAELTARSVRTGAELWRRPVEAGTRVVAVQPGRVHLLTPGRDLVTIDVASGAERSRFVLRTGREKTNWAPGYGYAADGFVAVERLAQPVDPTEKDARYYRSADPIIFAAS
ncbi:PQQ-like domain-containing protein [Micromonospora pattaloongensis]|uniref:PQQ-like domain-containing protein n=1 Tax=Micromonospora pattaloongensis TaxID=405436 RepID=A0A1H3H800_9ACTN|nr:PQQ-binding-like beta-propeller repeat protein [Micromonospora pattaloongensis]SDY10904.1 PQQ-like domain-containing protein [Micromonospora pattaloongensis]